jgi:hypothetical protein
MNAANLAPKPLNVLFVLDPARAWRWQLWLAQALAAEGQTVGCQFVESHHYLPSSLRLLIALERLLFATPPDQASALLSDAELQTLPPADGAVRYGLAIDFTGTAEPIQADRVLRPMFDGVVGDAGALAAVLERSNPRLAVLDSQSGLLASGVCALEHPENFTRGLDGVFSRMAGLLLNAVHHLGHTDETGISPAPVASSPPGPGLAKPLTFLSSAIAAKASARLARLLGQAPRWFVAWRRGANPGASLDIAWRDFTPLPDGGRGYYADPFVLLRGDTAHVFIEEVPFATGKGIISHFTIDAEGKATATRPVLERPYHLSYPFVFERDGETWMIPETSANRTVELYRAERFPDRWIKEAVLLDDLLADDATLVEHGGRLWLFAGVRDWQASSWEALGLFHAETLMGPWQAHAGNPVLLDPAAARPAGAMFTQNGRLIRPAQDCRGGYGAGLAFARIDRLDEEGFAQEVVARVTPRTRKAEGLHTYNRSGDVEVIDLFGKV